ncbi:DUF536 domain-containing protein [Pediococcus pentosaceus]|uniref:DUF536 domain-containing protein n=1 Tax=Pediococcus pentosaceus TaxID=1255 RepID=UPI001E460BAD|nr:DUF536 domain-containing protein [Pediococcus pentosaceus]
MKLYSMKDIAEEIGKDKSNVYRYIKKNNIAHTDVKERTLLFNATQKNTVIKGMTSNSNDDVAQRSQHDQYNEQHSETDNNTDQIIAAMQDNIKNLKEQNALLAKQLESKDKQLDEAQKLIDQQQQLNLSTQRLLTQQNEPQEVKQQAQTKQKGTDQAQPTENNEYQKKATKKGFFKRLFDN